MSLLRPIDFGYPLTVSRNTDIPKFWMKRWFQWMDRGYINAPHPITGLPAMWSLKPKDVHSLVWWSKDFRPFILHPRRAELDEQYRQVFAMTITGCPEWETKVPPLDVQLDVFKEMVHIYGVEKMQWRYSPVPMDTSRFEEIAFFMADMGIRECYFSFLHSKTKIPETRSLGERREVVENLAAVLDFLGMRLLGCWDDAQFMNVASNCRVARCVDAEKIDELYGLTGLEHPRDNKCGCSTSIEVANQMLLPCPHACTYCYATPENQL